MVEANKFNLGHWKLQFAMKTSICDNGSIIFHVSLKYKKKTTPGLPRIPRAATIIQRMSAWLSRTVWNGSSGVDSSRWNSVAADPETGYSPLGPRPGALFGPQGPLLTLQRGPIRALRTKKGFGLGPWPHGPTLATAESEKNPAKVPKIRKVYSIGPIWSNTISFRVKLKFSMA